MKYLVDVNLRAIPKMLSMIPSVLTGVKAHDLETIKTITRNAYPSVSQIGSDALEDWLKEERASLLLVDVRGSEEFAVSHLRGAVNLRTNDEIAKAIARQQPARTVLYCSVGFRSSRLANLVAQEGLRNVFNLEGSIFQWANEGRALYQGDKPVQQVHPYGKRWMKLLKQGLASEC